MAAPDDFLDLSLNLEETHLTEGFNEGYINGLASGKEEGRQVGLKHGFEIGKEIGFFSGVASISGIPRFGSTRLASRLGFREALRRWMFRSICASLNVKLEYSGYPKGSDNKDMRF
ncbi:hypothetical protein Acr_13g0004640 [Actinidia rufa]|uniref:Essential protein Yae1 N-terminal domain-containing protein n=1 Tax=Actinidia rufa TaxID=165716 RepID=A0A7J0FKF2_9ERIC|nr:hypothetical protein Acr_13g0004640 [Actinidia rufa]